MTATFEVIEGFHGDIPRTIDVHTTLTSCGVKFQTGELYLVSAYRDDRDGTISAHACGGTRNISSAGKQIAYWTLRKRDPKNSARFEGKVVATDDDGRFTLEGLAGGE